MPNWCEGTIKFRGKREDIIKAITEGLQPVGCSNENDKFVFQGDNSEEKYLSFCLRGDNTLWIEGTKRHFVGGTDLCVTAMLFGDEFIVAIPFIAAWSIKAITDIECNGLVYFAKKYRVDVRATGFERGFGFKQEVEVSRNGDLIMDVITDYDRNYEKFLWECEMPLLGG